MELAFVLLHTTGGLLQVSTACIACFCFEYYQAYIVYTHALVIHIGIQSMTVKSQSYCILNLTLYFSFILFVQNDTIYAPIAGCFLLGLLYIYHLCHG